MKLNRHLKKIDLCACVIFLVFLAAMTSSPKDEIPLPEENFSGQIVDLDDVITEGTHLSINGFTYLSGRIGSTDAFIPLERIKQMRVTEKTDDQLRLNVELIDGSNVEMDGDGKDEITGEAAFGQFRIRLRHLKSLVIQSRVSGQP